MKNKIFCTLLSLTLLIPNIVYSAQGDLEVDNTLGKEIINQINDGEENRQARLVVILNDGNKFLDEKTLNTESGKKLRMNHTKKFVDLFKDELLRTQIDYELISEYNYIVSGVAIKTNLRNLTKIRKLPNVKYAYESVEYKLENDVEKNKYDLGTRFFSVDSNNLIGITEGENNHRGEGTVVAVIDSGIDVTHPILRVSNPEKGKYPTEQSMKDKLVEVGIESGKWYNNKVVFAKNYEQKRKPDNIKEIKEDSHGMHVAGISVGNPENPEIFTGKDGRAINERIVGVAPEAQLIFMRVFGENSGTNSDIYISAIEDAVKLGADSINMSLGSPNGTRDSVDPGTIEAINHAKAAGTVVAIAAGNDAYFGEGKGKPLATNPDYGTLATPSVAEDSLSVASANAIIERRNQIFLTGINERVTSSEIYLGYNGQTFNTDSRNPKEYTYVDVGIGKPENITSDLTGKIALIERGEITFANKVLNAQAKNAIGVIIYNKQGDDSIIGMDFGADKSKINIPVISIGYSDGIKARDAQTKTVKIMDGKMSIANPLGAEMSDFSSYGISTDGVFKPDITAPGGAIYSSINNNKYTSMNGTSMATPHVAGAIPIIKKELKKRHPEIQGEIEYNTIKAILMSTAVPVKEGKFNGNIDSLKHINVDTDELVSPRKQGAGLMDVSKALTSDLYLTDSENKPNIWLGDTDGHLNFSVKVHNIGNDDKTLRYDTILQTDAVEGNRFALKSRKLKVINGPEIRIPAKSEIDVNIAIDATEYHDDLISKMKNGYFLEGFVLFKDANDNIDTVSIPFSSFKGEWANLPVWEKPVYDHEANEEYIYSDNEKLMNAAFGLEKSFDATALYSHVRDELGIENEKINGFNSETMSFDKTKIAFSPISTEGYRDLSFKAVFIRNARDLKLHIENKDNPEEQIDIYDVVPEYRKNSDTHNANAKLSESPFMFKWDKNKPAGLGEGRYKYIISAKSTAPNAKEQKLEYDVILDATSPKITSGKIEINSDPSAKKDYYIPNIVEELSGLRDISVQIHYPDDRQIYLYDDDKDGRYEVPKDTHKEYIVVTAEDYAGNKTYFTEDETTNVNTTIRFLDEDGKIFNDKDNKIKISIGNMEFPDKILNPNKLDDGTYNIYLPPMEAYYINIELPEGYKINNKNKVKMLKGLMDLGKTIDFTVVKDKRNVNINLNTEIPDGLLVKFVDKENPKKVINASISESGRLWAELEIGKYTMKISVPDGYNTIPDKEITISDKDIEENIVIVKKGLHDVSEPSIPYPSPVPYPREESERDNYYKDNRKVYTIYSSNNSTEHKVINVSSSEKENTNENIKLLKKPQIIKLSNMKDVKNHWAKDTINVVVTMNLFKGVEKDKFAPDMNINNAMFNALLYRIINSPKYEDTDTNSYGIDKSAYYKDAVKYFKLKNIIQINGLFNPNRELTREEVAITLFKLIKVTNLKFETVANKVNDLDGLNENSKAAINKIVSYGIMKGKGNGKFDPKSKLTRAEFAQILLNLIDKAKIN